ncbi:Amino acid ABC transporter, permease protein, 3-TM region, His/Glu/Gln/Arg/opine [Rhodoferax ferrireducens T118]|uniref:Amino acid ABC transporter, permease protein, 3-TM region, His/Glu/Gln/Arg/opine n=1 Tax=Albidiferax ferrireducens (strain ATCC BAA-621 / DSM 15236 / T118) TaxID=338969 RepID=Q21W09_ALBFT|nr:amino acid ABC transporter permease [Rhodoferax ferrireducens]ABD70044.1 Amino acid ABC transporter, permease protein, 3-TM region, His/Glu/Gln/Arg/opine [Rhodoferax ferrireducens T118]
MTATIFQPIAARPAPVDTEGPVAWVKANLLADWKTTLATLIVGGVLLWLVPQILNWAVFKAAWLPNYEACRAPGVGACWGVIAEKYRVIIFGRYPFEEQWRPLIATVLLTGLLVASCVRMFWKTWLPLLWVVVLAAFFTLMYGNSLGLTQVDTDRWGGLPLTILLASLSLVMSFPIALLVALGRRSSLPAIRSFCTIYVELIRGVPLISVLFMASFMFPLFMPQGFKIDVLIRVLVGITLFAAAYSAEVIRGGLQAIPKGQVEAAATLGLSYWQTQRKIVLPQALAMVVPGIMNNFISTFKDTSLVTIVSLYELTGAMSLALNSDSNWRPFTIEGYIFIALIYFVFCFSMSRYSHWVEKQVNKSKLR